MCTKNQLTREQLQVSDRDIILQQHESRNVSQTNSEKIKCKKEKRLVSYVISVGDIVKEISCRALADIL